MYDNRWTHGHYVNCVFVFSPDGEVRMPLLSAPGTFHHSTMTDYGIYDEIQRVFYKIGGNIVVDSNFKIGTKDYLIKSSQEDPTDHHTLVVHQDATYARQLSKQGMRMIYGLFSRLKDSLYYEEKGDCMVIL